MDQVIDVIMLYTLNNGALTWFVRTASELTISLTTMWTHLA